MGQLRMLNIDLATTFLHIFLSALAIGVLAREILVYSLRRRDREQWVRLGSTEFMDRNCLFSRYPYKGWKTVYRSSQLAIKVIHVIFAICHVVILGSLVSALTLLLLEL
ncbi:MAG: hypothetical protein ABW207_08210 [Stenotrophomonas chelatiphaga]